MDEGFHFHLSPQAAGNLPDLPERQFPGQDDPGSAEGMPQQRSGAVGDVRLRADVDRHPRQRAVHQCRQSRIADDQRIRSDLIRRSRVFQHPVLFALRHEAVERQVHLHPPGMREGDQLRKFVCTEIRRFCPEAVLFKAAIHGIRAKAYGC